MKLAILEKFKLHNFLNFIPRVSTLVFIGLASAFLAFGLGHAKSAIGFDEEMIPRYFFIDVDSGFFPIPTAFVVRASSAYSESEVDRALLFSIPVEDYQGISIDRSKFETDRIYVRPVTKDFDPDLPPSDMLSHIGNETVHGLTITRFRLASTVNDLQSLKDTCFDRIVFKKYYVYITSDDCGLSKQLVSDFVYENIANE